MLHKIQVIIFGGKANVMYLCIITYSLYNMNIKKHIKNKGFTISKVAELMGVKQPALSKMLDGNPTINKLQEIADIIGVSLSELVADEASEKETYIICPHCGERIKLSVEK